jgi:hypothetical protein
VELKLAVPASARLEPLSTDASFSRLNRSEAMAEFVRQRFFKRHSPTLIGRTPIGAHAQLWERHELSSEPAGLLQGVRGFDQPVNEAHSESFIAGDSASGKNQI